MNEARVVLAALTQAIEQRDLYTQGHSRRVGALGEAVARRLGWREERLEPLRLGGLLHDVGKLNLDTALLRKPGALNDRERSAVRRHPLVGARLIRPFAALRPALPYVLFHHERWDGGGYPTGRSREQIPTGARILAVADSFDAMTSTRPYRPALSVGSALAEVRDCAGTQFDPTVVHAFLAAWADGDLTPHLAAEERLSA
ncbi:MAG: HD-GYP domain-containing protein [Actinobacteria bacterium]|nr:HD-GYP domain-containing protein [Actinomycetota bacterium]